MDIVLAEAFAEYKLLFERLDGSGFLTAHQLSAVMKQLGYTHNQVDLQQMINAVNCNATGQMSYATFCAALLATMAIKKSPRSL